MSVTVSVPLKKAKSSKSKTPASHPPVINMITAAILAVKDRKGSSLATIKKYIAANYKFDVEKQAAHIRRGIVHGVEKGALIRVGNKGKGASGSFKVAEKKVVDAKPKVAKPKTKVPSAVKPKSTPKKPKEKKVTKPKVKTPKKPKAAVMKKPASKKPKTAAKKVAPKKK
ncbi:Linker histone H1 [Schistosoma mansoni]|uniref:Linker histone H1 n=1 Tax=Schistosoma mansoni TaxID=6183 RepID=G4LZC4_SCHMA|nr:Linker histone H1 [Schistosoma mansoni]|eukprot:XP_018646599.1 Linker histone H1 [Schistosoma mansoni]